jgi:hypothetical protein
MQGSLAPEFVNQTLGYPCEIPVQTFWRQRYARPAMHRNSGITALDKTNMLGFMQDHSSHQIFA